MVLLRLCCLLTFLNSCNDRVLSDYGDDGDAVGDGLLILTHATSYPPSMQGMYTPTHPHTH